MLKTLRETPEFHIMTRDDLPANAQKNAEIEGSSPPETIAVLDAQFYSGEGQIWQAQQLVDMRLNLLLWSEIYSVPMSDSA